MVQAINQSPLTSSQEVWPFLRVEAATIAAQEPVLASLVHGMILNHNTLGSGLSYLLAHKLQEQDLGALLIREVCDQAYASDPLVVEAAARDLLAVRDRDPACSELVQPFLWFKGFASIQAQRVAHWLWINGRKQLARHFQSRVTELFNVDIHPASQLGAGLMLDHATGIVIGETAFVGEDCTILQGATLGGTGKESGDRHPKLGNGVLISVGANVLGNIMVGDRARVAAGSVVLKPVPADCTVAGVPAKPVGALCAQKAKDMDQTNIE